MDSNKLEIDLAMTGYNKVLYRRDRNRQGGH